VRIRHFLAAAAILSAITYAGPCMAVAPVGKTVQASSRVSASGAAGSRVLKTADPVYFNDALRSNATGVGQFQFVDGSKLAIGPNASITIDKFVYKGGDTLQRLGIQASKGAFRWISGKSASSAYEIVTPAGTMGIRGTAFDFTVRAGKTYLVLLQGNVRFCSGSSCKSLRRSCDYVVAGGGGVSDPTHLSRGLSSSEAQSIFPLLANQSRLASSFHQPGRSCLSKVVKRNDLERARALATPNGISEPPGPPSHPNNGFGNGPETGDGPSDTSNPGKGRGGPHRDAT
jgi:hypothetical protein